MYNFYVQPSIPIWNIPFSPDLAPNDLCIYEISCRKSHPFPSNSLFIMYKFIWKCSLKRIKINCIVILLCVYWCGMARKMNLRSSEREQELQAKELMKEIEQWFCYIVYLNIKLVEHVISVKFQKYSKKYIWKALAM